MFSTLTCCPIIGVHYKLIGLLQYAVEAGFRRYVGALVRQGWNYLGRRQTAVFCPCTDFQNSIPLFQVKFIGRFRAISVASTICFDTTFKRPALVGPKADSQLLTGIYTAGTLVASSISSTHLQRSGALISRPLHPPRSPGLFFSAPIKLPFPPVLSPYV